MMRRRRDGSSMRGFSDFSVTLLFSLTLLSVSVASVDAQGQWGQWKSLHEYNGVDFRVRCEGEQTWWVEFRNRYNQEVNFDFRLTSGEPPQAYSDRVRIAPGGTQQGWNNVPGLPCSRNNVTVFTNNWSFQAASQQRPARNCDQEFPGGGRSIQWRSCTCRNQVGDADYNGYAACMRRLDQ
jgi:hypothetical protein